MMIAGRTGPLNCRGRAGGRQQEQVVVAVVILGRRGSGRTVIQVISRMLITGHILMWRELPRGYPEGVRRG